MNEIYTTNVLDYTTNITSKEINKNISITLNKKLKNELEGKCIKEGYVKPGSIKIISRSLGEVLLSHFNGSILYHMKFNADICNPVEGMILAVKIVNINKMGALAELEDVDVSPLVILLARQHHIDNTKFENLQVNDVVNVRVLGKRFEYGDTQISIIGVLDGTYMKKRTASTSSISSISSPESSAPEDAETSSDESDDENEQPKGTNASEDEDTGDEGPEDEGSGDEGPGDEDTGDEGPEDDTGDEGPEDEDTGDEGPEDEDTGDEGPGDESPEDEVSEEDTGNEGSEEELDEIDLEVTKDE